MSRALALTLGEPAGIGPDITLAAWRRRAELNIAPFYMVADPDFLRRRAQKLGHASTIDDELYVAHGDLLQRESEQQSSPGQAALGSDRRTRPRHEAHPKSGRLARGVNLHASFD